MRAIACFCLLAAGAAAAAGVPAAGTGREARYSDLVDCLALEHAERLRCFEEVAAALSSGTTTEAVVDPVDGPSGGIGMGGNGTNSPSGTAANDDSHEANSGNLGPALPHTAIFRRC